MTDLKRLRELALHPHLIVDGDCWYSCPKARDPDDPTLSACCDDRQDPDECNCGADRRNEAVTALLDENDRLREALQLAAETYHSETHPSLGPADECAAWPCNPAARAALESSAS